MAGNRVWETTTTAGSGNITLAGATTNYQTFNNAKGLNSRFNYSIIDDINNVWEIGIGYLSGTTTLVREQVLENSAGTLVALVLSSGTKDVQITATISNTLNSATGFSNTGGVSKLARNGLCVRPNSLQGIAANRIHYTVFEMKHGALVDTLAIPIVTGAGTAANKLYIGMYDIDPNTGNPGNLLFSVTTIDPSVSGLPTGSFAETFLEAGLYYFALWSDTTPAIKSNDGGITSSGGLQINNSNNIANIGWLYINSQTGLTDLPAVGNATNALTSGASWLVGLVGHS